MALATAYMYNYIIFFIMAIAPFCLALKLQSGFTVPSNTADIEENKAGSVVLSKRLACGDQFIEWQNVTARWLKHF